MSRSVLLAASCRYRATGVRNSNLTCHPTPSNDQSVPPQCSTPEQSCHAQCEMISIRLTAHCAVTAWQATCAVLRTISNASQHSQRAQQTNDGRHPQHKTCNNEIKQTTYCTLKKQTAQRRRLQRQNTCHTNLSQPQYPCLHLQHKPSSRVLLPTSPAST